MHAQYVVLILMDQVCDYFVTVPIKEWDVK